MEKQTVFRWISVSERMPTKTDYYTCAAGADFKFCGQSYFSLTEGTFSNMAIIHWQEEVEGIVLSPEVLEDFEKQIVSIMESNTTTFTDDCGNPTNGLDESDYGLVASQIIKHLSK